MSSGAFSFDREGGSEAFGEGECEGKGVVAAGRAVLGATNPLAAAPGTIRADLGLETGRNLCHASDSVDSARREIGLWFSPDEIVGWNHDLGKWIHE